jgi:tRNA nucleotidyltransferase/poly(A) polymerase
MPRLSRFCVLYILLIPKKKEKAMNEMKKALENLSKNARNWQEISKELNRLAFVAKMEAEREKRIGFQESRTLGFSPIHF